MLDRFKKISLAAKGLAPEDSPFPAHPTFTPSLVVYACDNGELTQKRYETLAEGDSLTLPGRINWIRVVGIHDEEFVRAVAKRFGLHPLLVEDILDSGRRPVLEDYEELVFLLMRLLDYDADHRRILAEQVCLVSGQDFVLTFQEREANLWDSVATRLAKGGGKLLRRGQEHLTHALVTAILDDYILTLGRLAEDVEELEQDILAGASGETLLEVYRYKREVLFLHRSLWPLREVLGRFAQDAADGNDPASALLWSDIQQDIYQVLDAVETLREMLSEMVGLAMTKAELRMNAVGQYLSLVATIFLPLNFLVGFYGMNFDNLPFRSTSWGLAALTGLMAVTAAFLVFVFYRKRWLRADTRN